MKNPSRLSRIEKLKTELGTVFKVDFYFAKYILKGVTTPLE